MIILTVTLFDTSIILYIYIIETINYSLVSINDLSDCYLNCK
jgi:hypothetical protein